MPSASVWVGVEKKGVTRFIAGDPARAGFYDERHGLPPSSVIGVCEDRDGRLWVGTAVGASRKSPAFNSTSTAASRSARASWLSLSMATSACCPYANAEMAVINNPNATIDQFYS